MKKISILFITALIVFSGCYQDDMFEQPSVVSVTPERDSITILPDTRVIVVFSKSMDTVKTNGEFSLSSGSGSIDGYYSWDSAGRTLSFTPKTNLSMAEKYTIRITEGAEDREGNDLDGGFLSTFYTGGDLEQPRVVSYVPAANSIGNTQNTKVSITFSEPVLLSSVYGGIRISPSVEGFFNENSDSTVITFTPRYGFSFGVTYTVNITNSIKDEAGNSLCTEAVFRFTVGDDFTKPTLSAYQNLTPPLILDESMIVTGAEKDGVITLDFSEEILADNLESAVSISPFVPFYISSSIITESGLTFTRGVINFTENLSCEETYTLKITSTVRDREENSLDHDYRFVFRTDGPGSLSPVITSIGDIREDNSIVEWPMGMIPVLDLGKSGSTGLYDDIGLGISAAINPSTLEIHLETVTGQGSTPAIVNIDWPGTVTTRFTRLKFGLYQVLEGNTYKIIIKGGESGLTDINGNYMKEDFIQIIRF